MQYRSGLKNANADGLSRKAWFFSKDALVYQGIGTPRPEVYSRLLVLPTRAHSPTTEDSLTLTRGRCREHLQPEHKLSVVATFVS